MLWCIIYFIIWF